MIIIGLVVAGIVWLVSALGKRNGGSRDSEAAPTSPREILDRRLAGGELTVEYRHLREAIDDSAPSGPDGRPRSPAGAPG